MLRLRNAIVAAAAIAAFSLLNVVPAGAAGTLPPAGLRPHTILPGACALNVRAGFSHCELKLIGNLSRKPVAAAAPAGGYGPSDLQSAYALPSGTAGAGQTVAIIELGGGFKSADLHAYWAAMDVSPRPRVVGVACSAVAPPRES